MKKAYTAVLGVVALGAATVLMTCAGSGNDMAEAKFDVACCVAAPADPGMACSGSVCSITCCAVANDANSTPCCITLDGCCQMTFGVSRDADRCAMVRVGAGRDCRCTISCLCTSAMSARGVTMSHVSPACDGQSYSACCGHVTVNCACPFMIDLAGYMSNSNPDLCGPDAPAKGPAMPHGGQSIMNCTPCVMITCGGTTAEHGNAVPTPTPITFCCPCGSSCIIHMNSPEGVVCITIAPCGAAACGQADNDTHLTNNQGCGTGMTGMPAQLMDAAGGPCCIGIACCGCAVTVTPMGIMFRPMNGRMDAAMGQVRLMKQLNAGQMGQGAVNCGQMCPCPSQEGRGCIDMSTDTNGRMNGAMNNMMNNHTEGTKTDCVKGAALPPNSNAASTSNGRLAAPDGASGNDPAPAFHVLKTAFSPEASQQSTHTTVSLRHPQHPRPATTLWSAGGKTHPFAETGASSVADAAPAFTTMHLCI